MTVDVARRRTRKAARVATPSPGPIGASESISIGEIDQTVFSCPSCQRPLAMGAKRCPGCGTHMLMGVQLGKVSAFVIVGLILGVAFGGGLSSVAMLGNNASRDAEIAAAVSAALAAANVRPAAAATTAPVASARPVATTKSGAGSTGIPPLARDALTQAATVNAELAAAVPVLQAALKAREFDTYTVFQVLRSVSGNAVTGRQLAAHIGGWSGSGELDATLAAFYTTVQQTAGESLDASIHNKAAYKSAAAVMVKLLGGLGAVDAELAAVATDAGVKLPGPEAP